MTLEIPIEIWHWSGSEESRRPQDKSACATEMQVKLRDPIALVSIFFFFLHDSCTPAWLGVICLSTKGRVTRENAWFPTA